MFIEVALENISTLLSKCLRRYRYNQTNRNVLNGLIYFSVIFFFQAIQVLYLFMPFYYSNENQSQSRDRNTIGSQIMLVYNKIISNFKLNCLLISS